MPMHRGYDRLPSKWIPASPRACTYKLLAPSMRHLMRCRWQIHSVVTEWGGRLRWSRYQDATRDSRGKYLLVLPTIGQASPMPRSLMETSTRLANLLGLESHNYRPTSLRQARMDGLFTATETWMDFDL